MVGLGWCGDCSVASGSALAASAGGDKDMEPLGSELIVMLHQDLES